jgi:hypothetical protein
MPQEGDPPKRAEARSHRPRKRRHAAARSRVLAGLLSISTFLGLGTSWALKSATETGRLVDEELLG